VGELDPTEGQIVIDEWAGCMAAESIDVSPLGYLQAMVRRYRDGNFALAFAKDVAGIRAKPPGNEKGIVEIEICEADCEED
jgi:L-2-hydroxyglutarate oxidase LhgO